MYVRVPYSAANTARDSRTAVGVLRRKWNPVNVPVLTIGQQQVAVRTYAHANKLTDLLTGGKRPLTDILVIAQRGPLIASLFRLRNVQRPRLVHRHVWAVGTIGPRQWPQV